MKHPAPPGFTLIELLVVITIIGVLTGIALPVFSKIQLAGKRTQSLNNLRQFGAAAISYCGDNNGTLPATGTTPTGWSDTAHAGDATAWFNVLPRAYGNTLGLGDYVNTPASFYQKGSIFFVPAAMYPVNKLTVPQFAFSMNSKLSGAVDTEVIDPSTARLQNFQSPGLTCLFQETGLVGEPSIKGQTAYAASSNQCTGYATTSVARYTGKMLMVFGDGHADELFGSDVVDPTTGKAYNPQMAPAGATTAGGKMYWTMNTGLNANN